MLGKARRMWGGELRSSLQKGTRGPRCQENKKSPRKEVFFSDSRVRYTARKSSIMKYSYPCIHESAVFNHRRSQARGWMGWLVSCIKHRFTHASSSGYDLIMAALEF